MTNLEKYINDIAIIIQDYGYTRYNDNLFEGFGIDVLNKIDEDNFRLTGRVIDKVSNVKEWLLAEYKEPVLNKAEKEYLENVLRPFKDRVLRVRKLAIDNEYSSLGFALEEEGFELPSFKTNKMYKGMELDKEYTLEELELFED